MKIENEEIHEINSAIISQIKKIYIKENNGNIGFDESVLDDYEIQLIEDDDKIKLICGFFGNDEHDEYYEEAYDEKKFEIIINEIQS